MLSYGVCECTDAKNACIILEDTTQARPIFHNGGDYQNGHIQVSSDAYDGHSMPTLPRDQTFKDASADRDSHDGPTVVGPWY